MGRTLAAPLREGEPVTDVRVVAEGLLAGYPSLVAAPVRIADAGAVRLLRVGDRVDVVATDPANGRAEVADRGGPGAWRCHAARRAGDGLRDALGRRAGGARRPPEHRRALAGSAATDLLSVLLSE